MFFILRSLFILTTSFFAFFANPEVFAAEFPFSDITKDDPIYWDLKKLYERWVIDAPASGKFHPEALMDRDEFTAIAIGVGCRKCLTPTFEDVVKYRTIPFIDFDFKSPYFYCVSYAKEKGIVEWYAISGAFNYTCQNEKRWEGIPFCPANRTSRIEAIAVLLRQAGLWDEARNTSTYKKRFTFSDVSDYWYGYAQKAVDIGILSVDSNGAIRPDEYLTKREFVRMAATIFSLNLCEMKGMNDTTTSDAFASEIHVSDASSSCRSDTASANLSEPKNSYNFYGLPDIADAEYTWEFSPSIESNEEITAKGECLPNFRLPEGEWIVRLRVSTPEGKTSISYGKVRSGAGNDAERTPISVIIKAQPLVFPVGFPVDFSSIIGGWKGPYSYRWDFWDGTVSTGSDPRYSYTTSGIYPVTLIITDSEDNRAAAKMVVSAQENPDLDNDGILNLNDECPRVYGPKTNAGCPVVSEYSSRNWGGGGFVWGVGITLDSIGSKCLLSWASKSGAIFATALACTTCPCTCNLDFVAQSRRCDIFFPAILAPDKKTMYGRWAIYERK